MVFIAQLMLQHHNMELLHKLAQSCRHYSVNSDVSSIVETLSLHNKVGFEGIKPGMKTCVQFVKGGVRE